MRRAIGKLIWRYTPTRIKVWCGNRFNRRIHWMTPYLEAAGYEWNTWRPGDPGFNKLYYKGYRITPDTEIEQ